MNTQAHTPARTHKRNHQYATINDKEFSVGPYRLIDMVGHSAVKGDRNRGRSEHSTSPENKGVVFFSFIV